MKRTDSFVHDFKIVNIAVTTNVDDDLIKSITPPKPSFFMNYFSVRKPSISEDEKIEADKKL